MLAKFTINLFEIFIFIIRDIFFNDENKFMESDIAIFEKNNHHKRLAIIVLEIITIMIYFIINFYLQCPVLSLFLY